MLVFSEGMKGFLFILLADFSWGLSGTVAKHLFNREVSPYDLVQIRLILSFVILGLYLLFINRKLLKVERGDYKYFLVFGLFGVATVQFTYLYTIAHTNVATAVFLQYLAPVFILLYGLISRTEAVTVLKFTALGCAVLGGVFIVKGTTGSGMVVTLQGLIGGLGSAISFAFYTLYGKYGLGKYSPWTLLFWGMGVGGAVWAFYSPPWQAFTAYGASDWPFFIFIAVFATILPFGLFFEGLRYLTPAVAGITSSMEPVMAGVIAYILLGEILTPVQITGCALVLTAVVLVQLRKKQPAVRNSDP